MDPDTGDTTVLSGQQRNTEPGGHALSRKEIRRQKLMEFLAAKAKLKLPTNRPIVDTNDKVKMEKSVLKLSTDKENMIPPHMPLNKDTKVKTLTLQPTHNVNRPYLNNKGNRSVSNATGTHTRTNVLKINTDVKVNQFPVFTRTYKVATSKTSLQAPAKPKQQPMSTNTRATRRTSDASATARNSGSGRMIYGPIIKTRTGLVPAVTQPKNMKSCIPTAAAVNEASSRSSSHRPVSRASNVSLRTTASAVALEPVRERTAAMVQQNKPQDKFMRPSLSKRPVNNPQSLLLPSRLTSQSAKPDARVGAAKKNVNRSTSLTNVDKNKPFQGKAHPTSMPPRKDDFKVKVTLSNLGFKASSKDTETKKVAAKPKPAQVGAKDKGIPAVPQTAPQPSRTFSLTKSRAPPHTVNKTLTAAQEERIRKLQEWREAKGISYKRPSLLPTARSRRTVAVPQPFWSAMKEENEAHAVICAVDRSLDDCIKLLGEGCPSLQVKEVLSRLPAVSQKFAKFWICQVRVMEQDGDLDVLAVFEKAVGCVLEPVDELRTVVFEILKKRDENQENKAEGVSPEVSTTPTMTPKPTRALIRGERGDSSVVKYKITATPGGPPSQQVEPTLVNGQEVLFFTPVRRSVRIERATARYPLSLQDHDLCVTSYNDLMEEEEHGSPLYIYRENQALQEKVQVQYICTDQ